MNDDAPNLDVDRLYSGVSETDVSASTATLYGAAAVSLAMILLLAQIGLAISSRMASLMLASIALPLFTGLAYSESVWNAMKVPKRGPHKLTPIRKIHIGLFAVACTALMLSIGCLLWSLTPWATACFFFGTCVAFAAAVMHIGYGAYGAGVFRDMPKN